MLPSDTYNEDANEDWMDLQIDLEDNLLDDVRM